MSLETPALVFIKLVQVEGSLDGNRWEPLAQGQPIFRDASGVAQLRLPVRPAKWRGLRLTIDDQRSPPIPFTGARVHLAPDRPAPAEPLPVTIAERHENPGETRLTLNLGGANLDLTAMRIETAEPLFTRLVTLAVQEISEAAVHEQAVAQGVIYRVAVEGQPVSANLTVPLEARVQTRELLVLIRNQDNAPLGITGISLERRPVRIVFLARAAGTYHLLTGNRQCAAPRYDLAALGANLKTVAVSELKPTPLTGNPAYRAPEALSEIEATGAALNTSAWRYRKAVRASRDGVLQIELDLDVLAHAQAGFEDLRLIRDGKQLPYILERTSISRALTPTVKPLADAHEPNTSRWRLQLPRAGLPVTRLTCRAGTTLFQRDLQLYEMAADDRGEQYRRHLGSATWYEPRTAPGWNSFCPWRLRPAPTRSNSKPATATTRRWPSIPFSFPIPPRACCAKPAPGTTFSCSTATRMPLPRVTT